MGEKSKPNPNPNPLDPKLVDILRETDPLPSYEDGEEDVAIAPSGGPAQF